MYMDYGDAMLCVEIFFPNVNLWFIELLYATFDVLE